MHAQFTAGNLRRHLHSRWMLIALSVVTAAGGSAWATPTTIYKCFDTNLGLLYTDVPCKGEPLNIRAGDADPAAVAALQRERDALSRSIEQRITDNRRAALERERAVQWAYAPAQDYGTNFSGDVYYPAGYAFMSPWPAKRLRNDVPPNPERRDRFAYVPNPPRGLPRR